jgi:hypothetical protein
MRKLAGLIWLKMKTGGGSFEGGNNPPVPVRCREFLIS